MNLIRVDDRLIHGQVSVGWGSHIDPEYMIIANDEIAADSSESELYLLGIPPDTKGAVIPISGVKKYINDIKKAPYILVLISIKDSLRLFESGFEYDELNIGGIHFSEGKKEINHYIFLDQSDIDFLDRLDQKGIKICVQDLPSNKKYTLDYILNKWKHDER